MSSFTNNDLINQASASSSDFTLAPSSGINGTSNLPNGCTDIHGPRINGPCPMPQPTVNKPAGDLSDLRGGAVSESVERNIDRRCVNLGTWHNIKKTAEEPAEEGLRGGAIPEVQRNVDTRCSRLKNHVLMKTEDSDGLRGGQVPEVVRRVAQGCNPNLDHQDFRPAPVDRNVDTRCSRLKNHVLMKDGVRGGAVAEVVRRVAQGCNPNLDHQDYRPTPGPAVTRTVANRCNPNIDHVDYKPVENSLRGGAIPEVIRRVAQGCNPNLDHQDFRPISGPAVTRTVANRCNPNIDHVDYKPVENSLRGGDVKRSVQQWCGTNADGSHNGTCTGKTLQRNVQQWCGTNTDGSHNGTCTGKTADDSGMRGGAIKTTVQQWCGTNADGSHNGTCTGKTIQRNVQQWCGTNADGSHNGTCTGKTIKQVRFADESSLRGGDIPQVVRNVQQGCEHIGGLHYTDKSKARVIRGGGGVMSLPVDEDPSDDEIIRSVAQKCMQSPDSSGHYYYGHGKNMGEAGLRGGESSQLQRKVQQWCGSKEDGSHNGVFTGKTLESDSLRGGASSGVQRQVQQWCGTNADGSHNGTCTGNKPVESALRGGASSGVQRSVQQWCGSKEDGSHNGVFTGKTLESDSLRGGASSSIQRSVQQWCGTNADGSHNGTCTGNKPVQSALRGGASSGIVTKVQQWCGTNADGSHNGTCTGKTLESSSLRGGNAPQVQRAVQQWCGTNADGSHNGTCTGKTIQRNVQQWCGTNADGSHNGTCTGKTLESGSLRGGAVGSVTRGVNQWCGVDSNGNHNYRCDGQKVGSTTRNVQQWCGTNADGSHNGTCTGNKPIESALRGGASSGIVTKVQQWCGTNADGSHNGTCTGKTLESDSLRGGNVKNDTLMAVERSCSCSCSSTSSGHSTQHGSKWWKKPEDTDIRGGAIGDSVTKNVDRRCIPSGWSGDVHYVANDQKPSESAGLRGGAINGNEINMKVERSCVGRCYSGVSHVSAHSHGRSEPFDALAKFRPENRASESDLRGGAVTDNYVVRKVQSNCCIAPDLGDVHYHSAKPESAIRGGAIDNATEMKVERSCVGRCYSGVSHVSAHSHGRTPTEPFDALAKFRPEMRGGAVQDNDVVRKVNRGCAYVPEINLHYTPHSKSEEPEAELRGGASEDRKVVRNVAQNCMSGLGMGHYTGGCAKPNVNIRGGAVCDCEALVVEKDCGRTCATLMGRHWSFPQCKEAESVESLRGGASQAPQVIRKAAQLCYEGPPYIPGGQTHYYLPRKPTAESSESGLRGGASKTPEVIRKAAQLCYEGPPYIPGGQTHYYLPRKPSSESSESGLRGGASKAPQVVRKAAQLCYEGPPYIPGGQTHYYLPRKPTAESSESALRGGSVPDIQPFPEVERSCLNWCLKDAFGQHDGGHFSKNDI